jgi:quercetin dioxygenase-like cupin family protein
LSISSSHYVILKSCRTIGDPGFPAGFKSHQKRLEREKPMKMLFTVTAAALVVASSAWGQDDQALPSGFDAQPVLKSTKTADGDPLQLPTTGQAEIVSVIGTLEPGGRTARHKHPVPVFVYLLEGELEVQTEGGEPRLYKTGEAFLESVDRWHQAFNNGSSPTKILVVFIGEEGKPTTQTE